MRRGAAGRLHCLVEEGRLPRRPAGIGVDGHKMVSDPAAAAAVLNRATMVPKYPAELHTKPETSVWV